MEKKQFYVTGDHISYQRRLIKKNKRRRKDYGLKNTSPFKGYSNLLISLLEYLNDSKKEKTRSGAVP